MSPRRPAKRVAYPCDQCGRPATVTTWFRLHRTRLFVPTKRCDAHPYEPPPWIIDLRQRKPRRPTRK